MTSFSPTHLVYRKWQVEGQQGLQSRTTERQRSTTAFGQESDPQPAPLVWESVSLSLAHIKPFLTWAPWRLKRSNFFLSKTVMFSYEFTKFCFAKYNRINLNHSNANQHKAVTLVCPLSFLTEYVKVKHCWVSWDLHPDEPRWENF